MLSGVVTMSLEMGMEKVSIPWLQYLLCTTFHNLFSALNIPQTLYEHDHCEKGQIFAQCDNDQGLGYHEEQELVAGGSVRIGMRKVSLTVVTLPSDQIWRTTSSVRVHDSALVYSLEYKC